MSEANQNAAQNAAQQTEGNQANNQNQAQQSNQTPEIDYNKLADIIAGKQSATEDSVLKGYFKQQGLSSEEAKQAIEKFKAEKQKNTPDVGKMQSDLSNARKEKIDAEIKQSATLEAIKQGVDINSIPYVLKMAEMDGVADADGKISNDKISEAIKKVLEDVPALKGKKEGSNGSGFEKIGGDGNNEGNQQSSDETLRKAFGLKPKS